MAFDILIAAEAQQDIDESFLWYEEQEQGLGARYYTVLIKVLDKLSNNPAHYSFLHEQYRHVVLPVFPFHVIFKIISETEVLVLAVWHSSKNPEGLFKRMK